MIEIENVSKRFDDKSLFENFSMKILDGEFVVFAGKSGCGKTTMLNMIGALEKPDFGHIYVDGKDIYQRKNKQNFFAYKVGFLFQNFALVEGKTVKKNLEFIQKCTRTEISIQDALKCVGLSNKENTMVYKLSGGEQQRVALARLMLKKCDIILADEPTGSLDSANAESVIEILHLLNKQGKTIILVTHDEKIIKNAKKVIML